MKSFCRFRGLTLVASGLMLLQVGGCTFAEMNQLIQTVLLGITAAGSVAILQNI